jgi:hypothetical protein
MRSTRRTFSAVSSIDKVASDRAIVRDPIAFRLLPEVVRNLLNELDARFEIETTKLRNPVSAMISLVRFHVIAEPVPK